jgi:hypothetical protein
MAGADDEKTRNRGILLRRRKRRRRRRRRGPRTMVTWMGVGTLVGIYESN